MNSLNLFFSQFIEEFLPFFRRSSCLFILSSFFFLCRFFSHFFLDFPNLEVKWWDLLFLDFLPSSLWLFLYLLSLWLTRCKINHLVRRLMAVFKHLWDLRATALFDIWQSSNFSVSFLALDSYNLCHMLFLVQSATTSFYQFEYETLFKVEF